MKDYVMNKFLTLFIKDEEGASAIEYALIAVMVALVLVAFTDDISTKVTAIFTAISGGLSTGTAA